MGKHIFPSDMTEEELVNRIKELGLYVKKSDVYW